jgi:type IV pilus assembly protein PilM
MAEQVTTLFIGDDAVNLLVVEGRRVKKWVSLPLEPGLVNQGLILDEARVADEVNKLFQLAKIGTRRVIAGISGPDSLYRLISLPQLPEAILPEAVKQEARRVIPMPLDEVYISYQRLPAPEGETRVFLAAFSRNATDVLIRTLRQAGVQPYIMDLAPLALCRTLNEPRAIIINVRLDHVDVMVVEDRLPQLIHRLSLAGEVTSLSESLPAIAEEVDRAITFYNSSHKRDPLDSSVPMFVCGDLTNGPESWQPLAGKLKCPVSILPSPVESPDGFNPSDFMVNIGLALKKLQPEEAGANFLLVNFNALPEVYQPKAIRLSSILVPLGVIIVIGLVIGMGLLAKNKAESVSMLDSQLTTAQSRITEELTEMVAMNEQIKQIEAQLGSVENEAGLLNTTLLALEALREQTNDELHIIVDLLPEPIDLVEINHTAESIMVSGLAPTEDDVFGYARDLRVEFGDVVISSIEAEEEEEGEAIIGYRFELLLRW